MFCDRRAGSRSGRTRLEHLRILDERLGNTIPGIVGCSIVLILVWEKVVDGVGVALLWSLATARRGLVVCLVRLLG